MVIPICSAINGSWYSFNALFYKCTLSNIYDGIVIVFIERLSIQSNGKLGHKIVLPGQDKPNMNDIDGLGRMDLHFFGKETVASLI